MTRALRLSFPFKCLAAVLLPLLSTLVACSSTDPAASSEDGGTSPESGTPRGDGEPSEDAGPPRCNRAPAPDDRSRKVVVSHPYGPGNERAKTYEVLDLTSAGELTSTGQTFEMDRAFFGDIVFTVDGKVGLVAQDDGTVGVFTLDDAGKPTVVEAALKGDFYAQRVVVSPDGERAFVLDSQTKENGGGVYELAIGCDGSITSKGLVVPGGTAQAMAFLPNAPTRALLIAGGALDAPAGSYAHVLELGGAKPSRVTSGSAFPDKDAIASWLLVTPDGKYGLVTDNNSISAGSRMAPIALDSMTAGAPIATPNPVAVVMSPFGNAALLLNSDGEDALRVLSYDATNTSAPFAIAGEVAYKGGRPQLPGTASVIDRGALKGRVLVAENTAIRQLAFAADGSVTDLSTYSFGDGVEAIAGKMGVQP